MAVPDRIERTLELAHSPESVWAALTTAEGLGGWFGTSADVDLRPDGEAHVKWEQNNEEATLQIKIVEPPRQFAFTWPVSGQPESDPRRTYVEFTLTPIETGTRLTVIESGFAQLPNELLKAYEGNVEGWRMELGELVEYLDAAA